MLAQALALAVAIGSIAIYLTAFFFPRIHRKNDFIWSGVGLFYGLVLWVFARRITGGLLLGHVASVALLGWFGWQTMSLRRQVAPLVQQTPIPVPTTVPEEIPTAISQGLDAKRIAEPVTKVKSGGFMGLGGIFSSKKSSTKDTKPTESTTLDKAAIDAIAADPEPVESTIPTETATEDITAIEVPLEETTVTETEVEVEAISPVPPSTEPETETQTPPLPEAVAPEVEPPTEDKPPIAPGEDSST
jgi:hypothetical protein